MVQMYFRPFVKTFSSICLKWSLGKSPVTLAISASQDVFNPSSVFSLRNARRMRVWMFNGRFGSRPLRSSCSHIGDEIVIEENERAGARFGGESGWAGVRARARVRELFLQTVQV